MHHRGFRACYRCKIWAHSENSSHGLVPQAGYGPGFWLLSWQTQCILQTSATNSKILLEQKMLTASISVINCVFFHSGNVITYPLAMSSLTDIRSLHCTWVDYHQWNVVSTAIDVNTCTQVRYRFYLTRKLYDTLKMYKANDYQKASKLVHWANSTAQHS